MSSKGIDIGITSDSRDFVKAVDEGTESLEDLSGALDDAAKDGDKAAEKLTDSFDETVKKVNELGDKSESAMRRMRKSTSDAGEGVKNLKDESISTAKEAAASFDGSAESIVDAFQEVAANAFTGFGASGVVAGLAAAAGLGVIVNAYQEIEKANQLARQQASDLASVYIDSGRNGAGAIQAMADRLKDLALETDTTKASLGKIADEAKNMGEDFKTLAGAYVGASDDLQGYIDKLKTEQDAIGTSGRRMGEWKLDNEAAYDSAIENLEAYQKTMEEAQTIEEQTAQAGLDALQAKADAIQGVNDAYDQVVNSVTDFVDSETGVLDVEAYLSAIEARRQALVDYQRDLASSNLTDEQKSALNAMGQEAAAVWLEAYTSPSTTDEQKRRMSKSLEVASSEASGVAMSNIESAFGDGVETTLKIDTKPAIEQAKRDLDNWSPDEKAMRLRVTVVDQYGRVIP